MDPNVSDSASQLHTTLFSEANAKEKSAPGTKDIGYSTTVPFLVMEFVDSILKS